MATKDATTDTSKLETIDPETNELSDPGAKEETRLPAIGSIREAEFRFESGARIAVAANAVAQAVPEDDLPFRWQLISAIDEMLDQGGCTDLADGMAQGEAAYEAVFNGYRVQTA